VLVIKTCISKADDETNRGLGRVITHVHGCVVCESESSLSVSCSWVLYRMQLSWGGEGVLRPGCGSKGFVCGRDVGEGESLRMIGCFGCVLMAGAGAFMLQERNVSSIVRRRMLQG
jgi:hypothetical protein